MGKKFFFLFLSFLFTFSFTVLAKKYKGAEIVSVQTFKYGRFDVRYKPANREAVVSSFFTFHHWSSGGVSNWNEIDIEFVGRYKNNIQFNSITPGQTFHIRSQYVEFDPYIDFHEYGFEWTPDYIAWFINGEEVFRQTGDHVQTLVHSQNLEMNLWIPQWTNWVGYFNDSFLPVVAEYDWVQYSTYTPNSGNYGTDNNFSTSWKDEFETFDSLRWVRAAHSFSGNLVDFVPENVVIKDGILKLIITDPDNLGDVDNVLPSIIWARANYDKSVLLQFSEKIEKSSAENISNYIISGIKILSAELTPDQRQVLIATDNYDPFSSSNLIVKNITEDKFNPNIKALQAVTINKITPLTYPVKVNLGGDAYNDYLADQEWASDKEYGYYSGKIITWGDNLEINGTEDDYVFRTDKSGIFSYKFKVPNGTYELSLLFSENDNNDVGTRLFSVIAEGVFLEKNIDVFSKVGKNTIYELKQTVSVDDEVLDIYFQQDIDSSFCNAIVIDQLSTGVEKKESSILNGFQLLQNYPNPFNGYTQIKYSLNQQDNLTFEIFDSLGKLIYSKYIGSTQPGLHSLEWNGLSNSNISVSSGVYYYKLKGEQFSKLKKLVFIK